MASNITLSAGVRQNLLSLQNTASLSALTQNRLATGKKVNSALDNPLNYFTSASLQDRAGDLGTLLDSIGQATQTLKAADQGITSLTTLVQSAKSIATQALQTTKGTVNYTNITGSVAIAADVTRVAAGTVAGAGVASVQSTSVIQGADLAGMADGETISITINGSTKTFSKLAAGGTANAGTFANAAELAATINDATAGFGGAGAHVAVAAAAANVTVTSLDVTQNVTSTSNNATVLANRVDTAATIGDALTISDGTNTKTFYRVAANNDNTVGTFTSAADLDNSIAASSLNGLIASDNTGLLTRQDNGAGAINISGALGNAIYGSGTSGTNYAGNYNSTLASLSGNLTVQIGSGTAQTITFGSGTNIHTKAALNTALAALTDTTGSVDSTGHVNIAPTSSDDVTISGSAPVLSGLGLSAGTTTPTSTIVTANATRANLQSDFNNLLTQNDQLANDSSYNGINLLSGDSLKVVFNGEGTSSLTIQGVKFNATGLNLTSVSGTGFQDNKVINDTLTKIGTALTTLRTQASKFGSNLTTVQTRQDFTKNVINNLQTGADALVLADTNEEGANLLALQTRQQLSTTALSMANQASQAVLRLFG
jgi:flagellin-like hook-associated protein FlgL